MARDPGAYRIGPGWECPSGFDGSCTLMSEKIYVPGREYRRVSVTLSALQAEGTLQNELFGNASGRAEEVARCLATINERFGRGMAVLGSAKLSNQWEMQRQYLSPAYTTDFREIPVAHTS